MIFNFWFPFVSFKGIESFSKLGDSIYFEEKGSSPGLYIIQYIPSTLDWKYGQVSVSQKIEPVVSWDNRLRVTITISSNGVRVHSVMLYLQIIAEFYFHLADQIACRTIKWGRLYSVCFFQHSSGASSTLNLRIPSWTHSSGAKATLNGKDFSLPTPGVTFSFI